MMLVTDDRAFGTEFDPNLQGCRQTGNSGCATRDCRHLEAALVQKHVNGGTPANPGHGGRRA